VSKFKVGDRVRVVSCGYGNMPMGSVGVVDRFISGAGHEVNGDPVVVIPGVYVNGAWGNGRRFDDEELIKENQMKDDDVVTATAGRIRSAAGKCPQANQVLREVYPEVFKEEVEFQVGDIVEYIGQILEGKGELGVIVRGEDVNCCVGVQYFKSQLFSSYGKNTDGCFRQSTNAFKLILRPNLICTPKS
jgi:hypothetical protein